MRSAVIQNGWRPDDESQGSEYLRILKQIMSEYLKIIASSLSQVPENQQVVLAVRLDYLSWENTTGLPGLIVAKADRRNAAAGNIAFEEQ